MTETTSTGGQVCPTCGAAISATTPAGQCTRCLIQLALGEGSFGQSATPAPRPAPAKYFGDYELVREIARGGMGVVWEARQLSANRPVALKLLIEGQFAAEAAIKRFQFEAEAAANLDHPNIVPIYDVGQHDGWPYLAMKLVEGQTLADLASQDSSPNDIADLLSKVARAVHFAHLRGILHRDLKPSNILIDKNGEPHVTDFGAAKSVTADGRLTLTGAILGSPFYMAPEQITGKTGQLSTAVDTYSLGIILYELLTRQLPFHAETPLATLKLVLETEPKRPCSINPKIPHDLETICLKCLHRNPAARFESAAALAADLERWLRREPILSRRVGSLERSWKWTARHPLKAGLAAASAAAVLGPLISTFYLYHFVLPEQARSHPIIGLDRSIDGYLLTLDTGRVDRATMNFDLLEFKRQPRKALLYFTNLPPEALAWTSNLEMQVFGDIPGVTDRPRGPVVRPGQWFNVEHPGPFDRAYYICPFGWQGQDILKRDPHAHLVLQLWEDTPLRATVR
jgi:protein kinase-like protein